MNGTAAHVLDFDNATNTMLGHASATMVPALIAAGVKANFGTMTKSLRVGQCARGRGPKASSQRTIRRALK